MDRTTTRNALVALTALAALAALALAVWAFLRWLRRPLTPVPRVDLDRFAGTWHPIAGSAAVERRLGPTSLTVTHQGLGLLDLDLPLKATDRARRQRVVAMASAGGGVWKLDGGPLGRELAVLALAPDYGSCLVGSPDRKVAVVLGRARSVDGALWRAYRDELGRQGFDGAGLRLGVGVRVGGSV